MSNIKVGISGCDRHYIPSVIYKTIILKPNHCRNKNILTQDMLNEENVKYVIKYNFDLDGKTITVPNNCILEFDGGSLKNGTIIGQNTLYINVGDTDIWGENLTREGTWREKQGGGIPDKEYDPEHNSGLGRKTLELDGDSNILTQEDFDQENTIYVITYDFDLNGEEIEIPDNCTLQFEGGSFYNGTLHTNGCRVIGKQWIGSNMEVDFIIVKASWIKGYTKEIVEFINNHPDNAYTFDIDYDLAITDTPFSLHGLRRIVITSSNSATIILTANNQKFIVELVDCYDVVFKNIIIRGNARYESGADGAHNAFSGIILRNCSNTTVNGCKITRTKNNEDKSYFYDGTVGYAAALLMTADTDKSSVDNVISNCRFVYNSGTAVFLRERSAKCCVVNNDFYLNWGSAFSGYPTLCTISHNNINTTGYSAISINGNNNEVSYNNIDGANYAGINVGHESVPASHVVIKGNIVRNCWYGCIYGNNASDVIISDNILIQERTHTDGEGNPYPFNQQRVYCINFVNTRGYYQDGNSSKGEDSKGSIVIENNILKQYTGTYAIRFNQVSDNYPLNEERTIDGVTHTYAEWIAIWYSEYVEPDINPFIIRNNKFYNGLRGVESMYTKVPLIIEGNTIFQTYQGLSYADHAQYYPVHIISHSNTLLKGNLFDNSVHTAYQQLQGRGIIVGNIFNSMTKEPWPAPHDNVPVYSVILASGASAVSKDNEGTNLKMFDGEQAYDIVAKETEYMLYDYE